MSWTAVVPLRGSGAKSRLAARLSPTERSTLVDRMAAHVRATLRACPAIAHVRMLAPTGQGLNVELAAARAGDMLVIHADLPLLGLADVEAMLAAAGQGVAIAPDRHGVGTNALALRAGTTLPFAFGTGSFARHLASAPEAAVVRRPGLAFDIDTPDDLDAAVAAGFVVR